MAELNRKSKKPTIFKYDTLRRGHNEIRLLEVLPPSAHDSNADLRCSLTTYSRPNKCPPYIALSYTWGYEGQTHKIELNGQQHYVKDNVWRLLQELRTTNSSGRLWIDAVCINQLAAYEKSWQVASMGSIYAGAEEVVAWLGPRYEDSDLAMDWILNKSFLDYAPSRLSSKAPEFTSKETTALLKLFSRPYWKRVWVVQEILLAKNVVFMCGAKSLDWHSISQVLASMREQNIEGVSLFDDASPETPGEILLTEKEYWETHVSRQQGLPLKFLLDTWGHMNATVPIDKVYAILGLSLSHDLLVLQDLVIEAGPLRGEALAKIAFNVSYFKRPTQVYVDVLRSVLLFHLYRKDDLTSTEFMDFGTYLATILEVELDTEFIKTLYKNPFSNAPLVRKPQLKNIVSLRPTRRSKEPENLLRDRWTPSSVMHNEGGPTDLLVLGGGTSNHPLGEIWIDRDDRFNLSSRVRDSRDTSDDLEARLAVEVLRAKLRNRKASRRQREDRNSHGDDYRPNVSDLPRRVASDTRGDELEDTSGNLEPSTYRNMFSQTGSFEQLRQDSDRIGRLMDSGNYRPTTSPNPRQVDGTRERRTKAMEGYRCVEPRLIDAMFVPGRVLDTLADESAGGEGSSDAVPIDPVHRYGAGSDDPYRPSERLSIEVRRFLVIKRQDDNHSICVPTTTYGGRGVTGRPDAEKHAMLYTRLGRSPTSRLDEESMNGNAIQMRLRERYGMLHEPWRINFGKVHILEHNVKMKNIGKVCEIHQNLVQRYFTEFSGWAD